MINCNQNYEKSLVLNSALRAKDLIQKVANQQVINIWNMVTAEKRLHIIKDESDREKKNKRI